MAQTRAWTAKGAKQPLVLESLDAGPLGPRTSRSRSSIAACGKARYRIVLDADFK